MNCIALMFENLCTINCNSIIPTKLHQILHLQERKSQRRAQNQLRHEEKMRDLEMLNNYNPWGKPGTIHIAFSDVIMINSIDIIFGLYHDLYNGVRH